MATNVVEHVFFDLCNVQKRATKSDTSGHCLLPLLVEGQQLSPAFWVGYYHYYYRSQAAFIIILCDVVWGAEGQKDICLNTSYLDS